MQNSLFTFFFAHSILLTNAFHVSTLKKNAYQVVPRRHHHHHHHHHQPLRGMSVPDSGDLFDPSDGDAFDVEAVRRNLESLVGGGSLTDGREDQQQPTVFKKPGLEKPMPSAAVSFSTDEVSLPEAPPLTSIGRERLEAEMNLLSQLENGDDALSDVWKFWFNERGEKAASVLRKAEELTGEGPRSWNEAEDLLKNLIDTHGVYWVEPVNRLATLYYMQGKLKDSEELCKTVLAVKPWHFGALSGIVMVYAAMHAVNEARFWASRRLPTFAPIGTNRRRAEWVHRALADAKDLLVSGERRIKDEFGRKDDHTVHKKNKKNNFNEFEEDAWQ